jgi:hypothetical protein
MSKVIILLNRLSENPTADEIDILDQVEAVEKSLNELGHFHQRELVDINLSTLIKKLSEEPDGVVFNLVESLNNNGGLVYFIPALIESLNYPLTGNPSDAMFLTTQKPLAKKLMASMGIPTPSWWQAVEFTDPDPGKGTWLSLPGRTPLLVSMMKMCLAGATGTYPNSSGPDGAIISLLRNLSREGSLIYRCLEDQAGRRSYRRQKLFFRTSLLASRPSWVMPRSGMRALLNIRIPYEHLNFPIPTRHCWKN